MKIYKLKPITNGLRHQLRLSKNQLSKKNSLLKFFEKGYKNFSGRSSTTGRITIRHKGGGAGKRIYKRLINTNFQHYSVVVSIFYDSNSSSLTSLAFNFLTKKFFLQSSGLNVNCGTLHSCSSFVNDLYLGSRYKLRNIPVGSFINCISPHLQEKRKYIRAAGTSGQLLQKDYKNCKIRFPSGIVHDFSVEAYATLGTVSNNQHNLQVYGKAGRKRLLGVRPSVRGIAMNPVDHPHGGRTNGGRVSVTPWGIPTRGKPTVKKHHV
jgi:large subunit ribosomal protein L2